MQHRMAFGPGLAAWERPGPGEKVLWLHGYTLDSSIWGELWERLPGWHHLGLDLPGHGESAPLAAGASLGSLAQEIGGLAQEHGVRHLVGLSFGTLLALQIVIAAPRAFGSLALAAPGLAGGPEDPHTPQRYRELAALFWQRGAGPWMTELWMRNPPAIFAGTEARPALRRSLAAVIDRYRWTELRTGAMRHMFTPVQTPALLAAVETPTLVLLGDAEMPPFRAVAETLERSIGGCRCALIPDAGHLCLLERPELAAPLLADHLHAHAVQIDHQA